jgi:hypothetical protein
MSATCDHCSLLWTKVRTSVANDNASSFLRIAWLDDSFQNWYQLLKSSSTLFTNGFSSLSSHQTSQWGLKRMRLPVIFNHEVSMKFLQSCFGLNYGLSWGGAEYWINWMHALNFEYWQGLGILNFIQQAPDFSGFHDSPQACRLKSPHLLKQRTTIIVPKIKARNPRTTHLTRPHDEFSGGESHPRGYLSALGGEYFEYRGFRFWLVPPAIWCSPLIRMYHLRQYCHFVLVMSLELSRHHDLDWCGNWYRAEGYL